MAAAQSVLKDCHPHEGQWGHEGAGLIGVKITSAEDDYEESAQFDIFVSLQSFQLSVDYASISITTYVVRGQRLGRSIKRDEIRPTCLC